MDKYEIVIVGGGTAGVSAARRASEAEGKVALIEPSGLGGIGYHQGPWPFLKALSQLSHEGEDIDWPSMQSRAKQFGKETEDHIQNELDELGVEVIRGQGTVQSPSSVMVTGEEEKNLKADKIILASGSLDVAPVTMPIDGSQILASDHICSMKNIPESILLVGATPVGLAWSWVFAGLGVKVFLCDEQARVWEGEDPELMDCLEQVLKSRKIKLLLGRKFISLLKEDNALTLSLEGGIQFKAEIMAFCRGRRAVVEGLGLDSLDAEVSPEGAVFADDGMRTSIPNIFAVGSMTGRERRGVLSEEEGRVAGANACGKNLSLKENLVPQVFRGYPPLGTVGCFLDDAHHHGFRGVQGRAEWSPLNLCTKGQKGWVKVIADRDSKKLVGGQAFGEGALEIISTLNLAVRKGLSPRDFSQMSCVPESPLKALQEASRICFRNLSDKR